MLMTTTIHWSLKAEFSVQLDIPNRVLPRLSHETYSVPMLQGVGQPIKTNDTEQGFSYKGAILHVPVTMAHFKGRVLIALQYGKHLVPTLRA